MSLCVSFSVPFPLGRVPRRLARCTRERREQVIEAVVVEKGITPTGRQERGSEPIVSATIAHERPTRDGTKCCRSLSRDPQPFFVVRTCARNWSTAPGNRPPFLFFLFFFFFERCASPADDRLKIHSDRARRENSETVGGKRVDLRHELTD